MPFENLKIKPLQKLPVIWYLLSSLHAYSVAMLELSIKLSVNRNTCTLLSKVCVEQRLKALVYVRGEAHIC